MTTDLHKTHKDTASHTLANRMHSSRAQASDSLHRRAPSGSGSAVAPTKSASLAPLSASALQPSDSSAHASTARRLGARAMHSQTHDQHLAQTHRASKPASQNSHSTYSRYRSYYPKTVAAATVLSHPNGRASSAAPASHIAGDSTGDESSDAAEAEAGDTSADASDADEPEDAQPGQGDTGAEDSSSNGDDIEVAPWDCPLCMEEVDGQDVSFNPCECGYQICRFCWHHIKSVLNDKCPACRRSYTEQEEEMVARPAAARKARRAPGAVKKSKLPASASGGGQVMVPVTTTTRGGAPLGHVLPSRKHLVELRVLQQNLVYVIGIPLHADCYPELSSSSASSTALVTALENLLATSKYFGCYGHIVKLVINLKGQHASLPVLPNAKGRASSAGAAATAAAATTTTVSAFLTFDRREDAKDAIETIDGTLIAGFPLRATYGTTKYCAFFLRGQNCPNHAHCLYLHEVGEEHNSYTKEALSARQRDSQMKRPAGAADIAPISSAKAALKPSHAAASIVSNTGTTVVAAGSSLSAATRLSVEPSTAPVESAALPLSALLPPVFSPTVFQSASAAGSGGKPSSSPAVVGFGGLPKASSSGSLLIFDPMNPSNDIRYSEDHASCSSESSLNLMDMTGSAAPSAGRVTSRFLFAEPESSASPSASDTLSISSILATRATTKVDDGLEYFRSVFPNIRVSLDRGTYLEGAAPAASASTGAGPLLSPPSVSSIATTFDRPDIGCMLPPPGLSNSAQAFLDQFIRPDSPVAAAATLSTHHSVGLPVPQALAKPTALSPNSRPFSPSSLLKPQVASSPAAAKPQPALVLAATSGLAPAASLPRVVPGYALKTKKSSLPLPAALPAPACSPPTRQPTPPSLSASQTGNEIVVVSKKSTTPKRAAANASTKGGSTHSTQPSSSLHLQSPVQPQIPSNTFSLLMEESARAERQELGRAEAASPSSSCILMQHKKSKSSLSNAAATTTKAKKLIASPQPQLLLAERRTGLVAAAAGDKPVSELSDLEAVQRSAGQGALGSRFRGGQKPADDVAEPDSDDLEPFQYVNEVDFDDLVEIFPCFPSILEHEVSKMSLADSPSPLPPTVAKRMATKPPALAHSALDKCERAERIEEAEQGEEESFDALEKELARAREEAKRLETKLMAVMQRNRTFVFIE